MDSAVQMGQTPMDSLNLALVQCFVVILCGYIAGRMNIVRRSEVNGLNTFVGTFSLPSLIFLSLAKLDFSLVNWKFLLAILIAKSSVFFVVLIISLLTKNSNAGRSALFAIFTTQSNDFAIGYPMINALYGSSHPEYSAYLYLMAPISLAILNPIGFVFLEINKRRSEEHGPSMRMFSSIFKGVVLNPVLLMTVLGIVGNLIFSHNVPPIIGVVLNVFGNAFSASALFLLGLMMVGKLHKLKGSALVVPGILIIVKLLILPLLIRQSVTLLNAGEDSNKTSQLSTFGFLYGTIPTAPALFIFTLRYNLDIDLIASAMVVCTFASAPLMFVSAKLISANDAGITPAGFMRDLKHFSEDVGIISIVCCVWLLVCFLGLVTSKFKSITHRCTLCLIIAQLMSAVGIIIWSNLEANDTGSLLWYIQFVLINIGVHASRLWTAATSIVLFYLSSRDVFSTSKLLKWFSIAGWGLPTVIVLLTCILLTPETPSPDECTNPKFQFGQLQVVSLICVLLFSFIVTISCLIMQQRDGRRNILSSRLIPQEEPQSSQCDSRTIVDVEDIMSPQRTNSINSTFPDQNCLGECEESECCSSFRSPENVETEVDDYQIFEHLVLLIFLLCSMFVGLSMSIGTLIMEQKTGIYTEIVFIDVALSFGQSLIILAIFGLNPGLGKLGCWLCKICKNLRADPILLVLPSEESLSDEHKRIREDFKRCHLANCRERISICRRRLLKVYEGAFTGHDLVEWLIKAKLTKNHKEAVQYGRCLLESRVLHHVDGTQHFDDSNALYTFGP